MNKSIQLGMATFIAGAGVAMGQSTQEQIDALEQQILKLQQQVENGGGQPAFLNQAAAQGLQFNFYGQITWQSGRGSHSPSLHALQELSSADHAAIWQTFPLSFFSYHFLNSLPL